jgi:hypothetical protein
VLSHGVPVTEGLFPVGPDFGPGIFAGASSWGMHLLLA